MTSPNAEQLRRHLARDEVPWGAIYAGGGGERIVTVRDLVATTQLDEATLDRLVRELGGRRESVIDPWSWPRRALVKLRRRDTQRSDAYVFPGEL